MHHHRQLLSGGLVLLTFLGVVRPSIPRSLPAAALHSLPQSSANGNSHQVVNVIVAGATGDLASKYLWVAMFRLALEGKSMSRRTFRFFAGASETLEGGRIWHEKFFDGLFAERVCGALGAGLEQVSTKQSKCREFLETEFKPSVEYAPLRKETHYRELRRRLDEDLEDGREEGRMVYLAIPPQFFRQACDSCELIHRYLRPQPSETEAADPFLRIVVEKPFGRDLQSAHELATRLRAIFSVGVRKNEELYVMDHYAGKPVVHAIRNYFELNAAALHPLWNSDYIHDIRIEMSETASLQNRVHYFDSAGIIRDIMVNHLQLLLNVAVAPSFDPAIYAAPISFSEFARKNHEAQLRFIKAMKIPRQHSQSQPSLFVAQYDEYATHYEVEMGESLDKSDHFTPTAARIELTSSLNEWGNTTFCLAAAKATGARYLAITVTFKDGIFPSTDPQPCTFTVTIQRAVNADFRHSRRLEWSCDIGKILPELQLPNGWEYQKSDDHLVLTPKEAELNIQQRDVDVWELGDELSAYDILLREVASGATEHFADLDEIEAAWALWTPVVNAAETLSSQRKHASYPAGTSPWEQLQPTTRLDNPFPTSREEL